MSQQATIFFFAAIIAASAHAQGTQPTPTPIPTPTPTPAATPGVQESTDPAKAEAVMRAASGIGERAALDPLAGKPSLARAETPSGLPFLSGGVTVEDRATMNTERAQYSLWVTTVAKPSGAYLAGAQLRVVDLKSKAVVLERVMEGPWLMLSLPAGQYQVEARFKRRSSDTFQTLSEQVSIAKGGLRQTVLRFDSSALVSPDMQTGPDGNMSSGAPAKPR
jgi:hypothetical protein